MSDELRPATHEEAEETISFALRYRGRKRFHEGDRYMADITAKHLVEKLEQAGFVLMKKPPIGGHGGNFAGPPRRLSET